MESMKFNVNLYFINVLLNILTNILIVCLWMHTKSMLKREKSSGM